MRILLIGYTGFVGQAISEQLDERHDVIRADHSNLHAYYGDSFDVIVNANGNAKKHWANQNPMKDFIKSVESVYASCVQFKTKEYIYISSLDVYKPHYYGINKNIAEHIIHQFYPYKSTFLRCGSVIGQGMVKGVLKDIMDGNLVYLKPESRLRFITNTEVGKIVSWLIEDQYWNCQFDIAGTGQITVEEIGRLVGKKINYADDLRMEMYFADMDSHTTDIDVVYPALKTTHEYIQEVVNAGME